jgi:hypothetical protein
VVDGAAVKERAQRCGARLVIPFGAAGLANQGVDHPLVCRVAGGDQHAGQSDWVTHAQVQHIREVVHQTAEIPRAQHAIEQHAPDRLHRLGAHAQQLPHVRGLERRERLDIYGGHLPGRLRQPIAREHARREPIQRRIERLGHELPVPGSVERGGEVGTEADDPSKVGAVCHKAPACSGPQPIR